MITVGFSIFLYATKSQLSSVSRDLDLINIVSKSSSNAFKIIAVLGNLNYPDIQTLFCLSAAQNGKKDCYWNEQEYLHHELGLAVLDL